MLAAWSIREGMVDFMSRSESRGVRDDEDETLEQGKISRLLGSLGLEVLCKRLQSITVEVDDWNNERPASFVVRQNGMFQRQGELRWMKRTS